MGSLQGGIGLPPAAGFERHQVGSSAGSVSERRRGAPMAVEFGAVVPLGVEEFMAWTEVG